MLGALGLGVLLRTWQWLSATSLWVDELWIVQNVRAREMVELVLAPLANRQIAPPGFLASVDVASNLFGFSEQALRLVPYLMAVLALVLLWRVGSRYLKGIPLAGAIALVAASPALSWYGSNVKQYSGDVALSLLLVLFALRHLEAPSSRQRAAVAGGVGALAILSSHAAVLTGAVLGVVLVVHWLAERRATELRPLIMLGGGWLLGALTATWVASRTTSPDVDAFMRGFWAEGFAPYQDGVVAVLRWIPEQAYQVLAHYLVFLDAEFGSIAGPLALLAVAGLIILLRGGRTMAFVLHAPLIGALLGGMIHVLPFRNRTALAAGAPLVLCGLIAIQALFQRRSRVAKAVGVLALVVAVLPLPAIVLGLSRPPYRSQETRPVLAELAERRTEEQRVYVYCKALAAADFYGRPAGLTDVIEGGCYDSAEELVAELRELPDGPMWFFFTQWSAAQPFPDAAKAYFEERGTEIDRILDPYGSTGQNEAAAILYDLGAAPGASATP